MNNEFVIGTTKTIIQFIKDDLIRQIKDIDLFDKDLECNGIENLQDNLTLLTELLNGLYQDIINGVLNENDKIKVSYNPMGAYYYEKESE